MFHFPEHDLAQQFINAGLIIPTLRLQPSHHIRIHLHHTGTPVLGDRQYFNARSADFPEVPRQMLHASELRFLHPATGKPVAAAAPLPRDFRDWLRTLRLT